MTETHGPIGDIATQFARAVCEMVIAIFALFPI